MLGRNGNNSAADLLMLPPATKKPQAQLREAAALAVFFDSFWNKAVHSACPL